VIQCPYFVAGFESFEERDKHVTAHQRSFMCTYESCDYSVIGLPSNAALDLHLNLCHEDISHDTKFPNVKARSIEKSLEDAIRANDPLSVTALATELSSLPEEGKTHGFVLQALRLQHREVSVLLLDLIGSPSEINHIEKARAAVLEVCETGDEEMLRLLLDRGGDPNMGFPKTDTNPVCVAIKNRHFAIAKLLLHHQGFEISRTRKNIYQQNGPLVLASKFGSLDILSRILEADPEFYKATQGVVDKNAVTVFTRAIEFAFKEGEVECAKLLVRWALENESAQLFPSRVREIGVQDVDKIVKILSEEFSEVNENGGTKENVLQAMAFNGDVKRVSGLLDHGADIDNNAGSYGTPLMAAASNGKLDVFNLLLDRGANIMATKKRLKKDHNTAPPAALDLAAVKSHETIVLALLARGASFLHNSTHFHLGCYCSSLQVVSRIGRSPLIARLLLEHGAEVDARPPFPKYYAFETPTQLAAGEGNSSILGVLLEWSPDINFRGGTGDLVSPLYLAAQGGHTSCVRQLLSAKGIDINAHENAARGDTALHVAIKKGRVEIVELLVEHGADVNAVNHQNETGLMTIMSNNLDVAPPMIIKLIDNGAQTNAVDSHGNTAFMRGALRKDLALTALEAFRVLLQDEATLYMQNAGGGTALTLCADSNNFLVAKFLLQCMVMIRARDSKSLHNSDEIYASLQIAASKGHEKIVSFLLEFIDNDSDLYGHCSTAVSAALHVAEGNVAANHASAKSTEGLAKSYWEIYSMLLKHGADQQ
jgi:ankyrin repeat protein